MLSWRVSQILFVTAIAMFFVLWLGVHVRWWQSILITLGFVLFVSLIRGVVLRIRLHRLLNDGKALVQTQSDQPSTTALHEDESADAYYKRGDAYDEIGEYGKAIAEYNKAIELDSGHAVAYYNRGCAYGEIGEYEKAIADYNKAIELDQNDADNYYSRGIAYREKGEVAKAVSDLEKCIGLSTDPELTQDARQALHKIRKSP